MFDENLTAWAKVYPNLKDCSIQIFSDKKDVDNTCSKILSMSRSNLEYCMELQKTKPCWIFFSVNPMKEGKRDKESVTRIQTFIVDIDEGTKDEQLDLIGNAPLLPSLVVESVHGFHLYYLATSDLTQEEYETGNQWLRDYYNWDQKVVKDSARVLRLPWFLHQKWEPVLVTFRQDLSSEDGYTFEQISKAFPVVEKEQPKVEIHPIYKEWGCSDSYWQKVNSLDNETMLRELSGTRWVDWEIIDFKPNANWTKQIRVNGKGTSCRIDHNWMIGSSDDGWPSYVQWLWYYKKRKFTRDEWGEFSKWINANHPELEEKKVEKIDVRQLMNKPVSSKLKRPDFTWWERWLDTAIWKLSRWQLVILTWETWAGKTTFATFMARKNPNSCYFVLEDSLENIAQRYALKRAWISKEEFNDWTWSDYKSALYEEAFDRFMHKWTKFVDIWHKVDVETLTDMMRQLKEDGYWMFFIDNLWFVMGQWTTEADQTAYISAKLVEFCLKENVCVVLLHHFKKWDWLRKRDISQLRGSGKLWDDAFFVANYERQDEWTLLYVFKDRTRWDLNIYLLEYDRWDFKFVKNYSE